MSFFYYKIFVFLDKSKQNPHKCVLLQRNKLIIKKDIDICNN